MERPKIESLKLENLIYTLPNGQTLFENINFEFPTRGLFWLKSFSGAGKSTLLRIVDGLIFPESGKYLVNGQEVGQMSFSEFTPYRLQFGLSFDFGGLIHNRTCYQNLSLILEYHKVFSEEMIRQRVMEMLTASGVKESADLRPSSVPGAVRKVVCVLRAFIHEPQVLLLDDPTTGLRKEARKALIELIRTSQRDRPDRLILVATDDQDFLNEIKPGGIISIHDKTIRYEGAQGRSKVA